MCYSKLANDMFHNLGGVKKHDLKSILDFPDKSEDQVETYTPSEYYDIDFFMQQLKVLENIFVTLSINIECLNAKFSTLTAFLEVLSNNNCFLDALFIQETWLTDEQCNKNAIKLYNIPGYHTIPLGRKCGRKGGLIIYLRDIYKFKSRKLYQSSVDWEGIFIDVTHKDNVLLQNKITLANVYRPPRDNYSNASISRFLEPFTQIFEKLSQEHSTLITGGDFNLDLLSLTTRAKFQEYLDLFLSNGSLPQITLPTRFSKKRATLIDQIFCRFTKQSSHKLAGIIATKLSDHLPCFSIITYNTGRVKKPKYIKIQKTGPDALNMFEKEIKAGVDNSCFNKDILSDPNINYAKLEKIIIDAKNKCFPVKEVKFNKYKHKITPWITIGIIQSIKKETKCI